MLFRSKYVQGDDWRRISLKIEKFLKHFYFANAGKNSQIHILCKISHIMNLANVFQGKPNLNSTKQRQFDVSLNAFIRLVAIQINIKPAKMIKTVLLLLFCTTILANLTSEDQPSSRYVSWKAQHNKQFAQGEDRYRMYLYHKKQAEVKAHNQNTEHTYKKAVNKFAAYTDEELAQTILGAINPNQDKNVEAHVHNHRNPNIESNIKSTPGSKNWVTSLGMDSVKDQGQCGSCWAFTTAGQVEYAFKIKNNTDVILSTQQLVDCTYYRDGCLGGWFEEPLHYMKHYGIQTEEEYPYNGTYQGCQSEEGPYKIQSFSSFSSNGCSQIDNMLLNVSPLSVPIYAYNFWFSYSSGIFQCATIVPNDAVNHAVIAVGIDPEYYLFQNSWGKDWGENGYIKIARNANCNVCANTVWTAQV